MILRDNIQTLKTAARILHEHGSHTAADECARLAAAIAVNIALGDHPKPAPGNRLTRITQGTHP